MRSGTRKSSSFCDPRSTSPNTHGPYAKKCSLSNAYRLAGTARSTIRDLIGIAELKIVNEVTYQSTLERLGDPKLSVKGIEQECRKAAGWPVAIGETPSNRQEAVAAGFR